MLMLWYIKISCLTKPKERRYNILELENVLIELFLFGIVVILLGGLLIAHKKDDKDDEEYRKFKEEEELDVGDFEIL